MVHPGSSAAAAMSPAKHADAGCVEVVALQPVAVVDHLGRPVSKDFLNRNVAIGGHELGGSERVDPSELASLLSKLEADGTDTRIVTKAGGSAANTARGLSRGFGVRAGLLGAVGDDQWGNLFKQAMRDARVDVSNLSEKPGATGRCACFVEEGSGQRTMRTCMQDAVRLEAREILGRLGDRDDEVVGSNPLRGASWVLVPGYAFYGAGLVDALLSAAAEANCEVALALASFEIVRSFGTEIEQLLRSGRISAVFANEDEARELTKYYEKTRTDEAESANRSKKKRKAQSVPMDSSPETAAEDALDVLQRWSQECVAVVTLGDKGCVARRWEPYHQTRVSCGAEEDIVAQDSTGAGDLFVSGFLYGLLRGALLDECAELGCLAGAAATQSVGAEVSDEGWAWVRDRREESDLLYYLKR
jgi:sugar/nucleoside kinase (ribokinase family)